MEKSLEDAIDHFGETALRIKSERDALAKALSASVGYMLNAKIDLETGAPKATAIRTIEGGIKMAREALATAAEHGDFTGLDAALDELRKPVDEVRE